MPLLRRLQQRRLAAASGAFGRLVLRGDSQPGGFRVLRDAYGAADAPSSPVRHLPSVVQVDLVQDGSALIPRSRTPIPGMHPYWEMAFGVGRTWREPGDGEWTRAALPFSLMEVNANCVHNGVLTFVYAPAGRISRVAYQVSSETCAYFKADLWGFLQAERLDIAMPDAGQRGRRRTGPRAVAACRGVRWRNWPSITREPTPRNSATRPK